MKQKKLLTILVLLAAVATGAWAQAYSVTMAGSTRGQTPCEVN